jgi:hypothetical protein
LSRTQGRRSGARRQHSASPRPCGQRSLNADRSLNLDHQASRNFGVNTVIEQGLRHHADGALDGPKSPQAGAGPGEQIAALLLPPPVGLCLFGMTVTDGFTLHRRGLALFAVTAELLAAPVIRISGFWQMPKLHCRAAIGLLPRISNPISDRRTCPGLPWVAR